MRLPKKLTDNLLFITLFSIAISSLIIYQARAHGSVERPISRAYNCFLEGPENPTSAACLAALVEGGAQAFYDWHEINLLADDQHQTLIPDGKLCSAGKEKYKGLDLPRDDWPAELIAPDGNGNFEFIYHATAPHSTRYFKFYVTKDTYDPTQPLKWSDLEADPFCTITSVTLVDGRYHMTCPFPPNKTGKHLIYNIWQRDDSPEAFYACSDVIFDDGNTTPTPTATPDPNTCTASLWNVAAVYLQGDVVSHNGQEWRAKWWTREEEPGTTGEWGVWEFLGPCDTTTPTPAPTSTHVHPTVTPAPTSTHPPATATPTSTTDPLPVPTNTPTATPTGNPSAWSPSTFYAIGTQVTYNDQTYQCQQAHTSLSGWEPPNTPALWSVQN